MFLSSGIVESTSFQVIVLEPQVLNNLRLQNVDFLQISYTQATLNAWDA